MDKILFVIEHIYGGGAEKVICQLSRSLEERYDVTLLVFDGRDSTYEHCKNFISLNLPGSNNILNKIPTFIKRVRALRKLKRENNYKACISFINTANYVNVASGGDNVIVSIRTVLSSVTKNRIGSLVCSFFLKKAHKVVTLSNYVRDDLIKNFGLESGRVITIYNPCNVKAIEQTPCLSKEKENTIYIVTAGRCVTAKGQWHLIKSFSKVLQDGINAKLLILGEGPLKTDLENLVSRLNLTEKVEFLGFVEDPIPLIKNCDIFVLPSLWEGFGNALVEAMACFVPVISAKCEGGPVEILCQNAIKKSYGVLTSAFPKEIGSLPWSLELTREELDMANHIKDLCIDEEKRCKMRTLAHERSLDFDIASITNQWINLIEGK